MRDYRANMKLRDFKEKHGISKWTVYAILDRHGFKPARKQNEPRTPGRVTGP